MNYLFENYPEHALSLDVSTDNEKAVKFYRKMSLKIRDIYLSVPDCVEFALFETPLDKQGKKIYIDDNEMTAKQVHPYFNNTEEFK